MKKLYCASVLFLFLTTTVLFAQYNISNTGFFFKPGLEFYVFNNNFIQDCQNGIEIHQHGKRVAANGDLRLEPTPGQWDVLPTLVDKKIEKRQRSVIVNAEYAELNIKYEIQVQSIGNSFKLTVNLEQPIPFQWAGRVGFNLELDPEIFIGKSYVLDNSNGIFQRYCNAPIKTLNNKSLPIPIASGRHLALSPNDPERYIKIESATTDILLFDGRSTDNSGWFVVRSIIPVGISHKAIEWIITPAVYPNWVRDPLILYPQLGYHPQQRKRAIIELDQRDRRINKALLYKILPSGLKKQIIIDKPNMWGDFLNYQYAIFDFSRIKEPGLYQIRYGNEYSDVFEISFTIYSNIWQPTLGVFFPVQMCHTLVRDRYKTWHGMCHMDDALRAPALQDHFFTYSQKENADTEFHEYEHLPGINSGGWHNVDDYHIATAHQAETVKILSLIYEEFHTFLDQTYIDNKSHYVELNRQDDRNDLLQQIEHGVHYLLAPYEITDHSFAGIISAMRDQFMHIGDPESMTDNKDYNAAMDLIKKPKFMPGKMDDRWAFTNRDSGLEYDVCAALASSARVLAITNDSLATVCLKRAEQIWQWESKKQPAQVDFSELSDSWEIYQILAAIELYLATEKPMYAQAVLSMQSDIFKNISKVGWSVVRIAHALDDPEFTKIFHQQLRFYSTRIQRQAEATPFGLPIRSEMRNPCWNLQQMAMQHYFLYMALPEIFKKELVFNVLNFVLGCHPGSNTSFVTGVGTQSWQDSDPANSAFDTPGSVTSGTVLLDPAIPDINLPWPITYQFADDAMSGAASYIFCVQAAAFLQQEK